MPSGGLAEHAAKPPPPGLTEPDPGGEEQWEAGQVWAHLAEFPRYWLAQAQRVIALPTYRAGAVRARQDRCRTDRGDRARSEHRSEGAAGAGANLAGRGDRSGPILSARGMDATRCPPRPW